MTALRTIAAGGLLLALAALMPAGCKRPDRPAAPAIDFTLSDLSGSSHTLSSYYGKTNVLIHFGTTWCGGCVAEVPALNELDGKYGDEELVILYVDSGEPREIVEQFVRDNRIGYTTLLDGDSKVVSAYEVMYIPLNVLVSKEGRVVSRANRLDLEGISRLVGR